MLSRPALARLLRRKRGVLRYCYERSLRRNPQLQGGLALVIGVSVQGRVTGVVVEENTLNFSVARCAVRQVKRWRFPKPTGKAAEVYVKVNFAPGG